MGRVCGLTNNTMSVNIPFKFFVCCTERYSEL